MLKFMVSGNRQDREIPSWMREERVSSSRSHSNNGGRGAADADPAQAASQFGNNLLKTANSWWKTGSKKVQQVVNDFNVEHDPNHPRWMREPHEESRPQPPPRDHPRNHLQSSSKQSQAR